MWGNRRGRANPSPGDRRTRLSLGGRRAQTPIDFAVGAGVFLLTLAFVVAFVPSLFDPFAAADTASPLVSDRVAAGLADDILAVSPAEPGVLSPACTVAFFEPDEADAVDLDEADCAANITASPAAQFHLDRDVQVVIHDLNESDPSKHPAEIPIETRNGTFENVELVRTDGDPNAVGADEVTVSQRLVSIHGDQYRLTVRVW
ncbi:DUF7287 family protein [Halorubrum laminariae]|uniref:Archaeal Type IV pilin N-terminal domain-containing protein n=1 Tax=Halorubrum laminariae TaxID=1433523 RepID=A0ABD6C2V9_9EURY|nr:hypothetical protein [Halorubrum laminariae]